MAFFFDKKDDFLERRLVVCDVEKCDFWLVVVVLLGFSCRVIGKISTSFPGDWDAEIHLEAIRRLKLVAVPCPGKMM